MKLNASGSLYQRAGNSIPGGVNSNTRFRHPHPFYMARAQGPMITDVDGNAYIDIIMGNGALILGHNYTLFNDRISAQLKRSNGFIAGFETPLSVDAAEKFLEFVPAERVRFCTTGTEAMMHCLSMARAYTGKNDAAVVEGAYNGWEDHVFVSSFADQSLIGAPDAPASVPGMGGLDRKAVASTLVIPFNQIQSTQKLLEQNASRLAACILEPVMINAGFIWPDAEYLQAVRDICDELNIVLIYDELLTGFRISHGGVQSLTGQTPDLSIFGKAMGNGHIVAAVSGKAQVMETAVAGGKTNFVGTFNGHQHSLAAVVATLDVMKEKNVLENIEKKTGKLIRAFNDSARSHGIPAVMLGRGGHFHFYFTDRIVKNYRDVLQCDFDRYRLFASEMIKNRILMMENPISHHAISFSHDDDTIKAIIDAMDRSLHAIAARP